MIVVCRVVHLGKLRFLANVRSIRHGRTNGKALRSPCSEHTRRLVTLIRIACGLFVSWMTLRVRKRFNGKA
jgi:hypothetical protein